MSGSSSFPQPPTRMGLLAGWGDYPFVVRDALREQGVDVIGVGIRGHVEPGLEKNCQAYRELAIGRLGAALHETTRRDRCHDGRQGAQGDVVSPWCMD